MTARRVARGIGAVLILVGVVVGIPALLLGMGVAPFPVGARSWGGVLAVLSRPDYDGTVILGVVAAVTWISWLVFTIAIVIEVSAQLRGRTVRGIPGVQRVAAPLIAAALALLSVGAAAPALAAPALAQPTSTAAATAASAQTTDPGDTPPQPAPEQPAPPLPTYVVRPGDSLWRIAQAWWGDGSRFQEIADLNYGVTQPDGNALDASHWLQPGWVLTLPEKEPDVVDPAQEVPGPQTAGSSIHVVQPGESLSSISRELLGESARYPQIVDASRGIVQPDGSTLTDPDLIRPGWTLVVPARVESPPVDAPPPAPPVPDPEPSVAEPPAVVMPSPVPVPVADSALDLAPSVDAPDSDPQLDLRTATGIGGMLAAGIVGLIAMRRVQARRSRRPGQRPLLPTPGTPVATFESGIRAVADPGGRATVDRLLRALGAHCRRTSTALPPLRAVRLVPGRYVELFADAACDLPQPWQASPDRTLWRLDADDSDDFVQGEEANGPAPYPSLVTVGQDRQAHLMLDLERVGCLDVRGSLGDARAVLAGLAIELGTSAWADDLQVTVVGMLAELAGVVDTGRIRHVVSLSAVMRELEARALDVEVALRQVGVETIAEARAAGMLSDAWTPEILLIGEQLGPQVRRALERLVAKVPGVGVAAVTTGADLGGWAIEIDPDDGSQGTLHPAGLAIRPQRLDTGDYPQALALLGATQNVPGPDWARSLVDVEEAQLIEIPVSVMVGLADTEPSAVDAGALLDPVPPFDDEKVTAPEELPGDPLGIGPLDLGPLEPFDLAQYVQMPAADDETSVRPLHPLPLPLLPLPPVEAEEAEDPATDETTPRRIQITVADADETTTVTALRTPTVRILGPVSVEVASGITMPAGHQRQVTELVAYLAFHPGATGAEISAALWPTRDPNLATRRSAISRARRWLGVDGDGHEYLPRYWVRDDGTAADQESAGYRLRGVESDWSQFLALVGDDVSATPMSRLVDALALVRGPAFAGVPPRKYVWAESLWQEITTGIVDVAHEVARRALLAGEIAAARDASRIARLVDPADERGWRNGIRAEWADGRSQGVTRLVAQLRDHLAALELDADSDTEDLITEVEDYLAGRGRGRERGA